jgi:hypothetical protein
MPKRQVKIKIKIKICRTGYERYHAAGRKTYQEPEREL